jgi:dienelactone hydrolase
MPESLIAVDYEAGGTTMTGYLADGSNGRRAPGVLVAHEAYGMSDHVRRTALRLAGIGYVAFALDLYGAAGFPLGEAQARHGEMMTIPGLMFGRARTALDRLAAHPSVDESRLAAIGFCQGGITALELARGGAPIRAAIGFHPGLQRPAGSPDGPIAAKVLMMLGDSDPVVSQEARAAFAASMRASGADWQLHLFGGVGHSYTNEAVDAFGYPGFAYDEGADRRSWAMMLALLEEVFEGASQFIGNGGD